MSNIVFISRSELLLVIFSIALVFSELLLQPSLAIRRVILPASSAEPDALAIAIALGAHASAAWPGAATT
eukprot:2759878-Pyramimonas_sp.AAC.1